MGFWASSHRWLAGAPTEARRSDGWGSHTMSQLGDLLSLYIFLTGLYIIILGLYKKKLKKLSILTKV